MNIEHWISELEGHDPRGAISQLAVISPGLARPAVPALLGLLKRGDRILGYEAARLAIHIGPDRADEIRVILQFLLATKPCGWMLPEVAFAFERLACQAEETVELLGQALAYPHFRIRVAAARGLASMGSLLEFVEVPLLRAMEDRCNCVTQTVTETLRINQQSLSPRLEAALAKQIPASLTSEERNASEELEHAVWRPRANRLNGLGDDGEDAVFFLRRLTADERHLSDAALLELLLASHGLPTTASSISEIKTDITQLVLAKLLHPIFSPDPVTEQPVNVLLRQFFEFLDDNVRVYSNATVRNNTIHCFQPVSCCLIDAGLIWTDDIRVGMFWIADED